MRWSIRWRLTLLNTLALAVLLVAFAVLVYLLLAREVVENVDRGLAECLRQLEHEQRIADDPAQLKHWIDEFWEHNQVACVVLDSSGQSVARTDELPATIAPPLVDSASNQPQFVSANLPGVGRHRLLVVRLPHAQDGRKVVLMSSMAEVDHTLTELRVVLLTSVPIMLLAAAFVAYFLAGRALAPVDALNRSVRSITAESLDRRLQVKNPHDELGRLTATVNDMVARLERSFTEMKRFTADASHELRTPLAVIRTEAEVALDKPLAHDEVQQLLGNILEECDRLTRLTDQLLALARQDGRKVKQLRESVQLSKLGADVIEALRPLAEVKWMTLKFVPNCDPMQDTLLGNPGLLRQVFINLLDNAIKYTPEGGLVEVQLESTDQNLAVRVRDTGEGIPAEHLPHVFERFYRVDKARSRELGGSGLGLSIAKSIVEAHGGEINLESQPGRGTTCTVTLPRQSSV